MSDMTKAHKIKINYECSETGQKASVNIVYTKGEHSYNAEFSTKFNPPVEDGTKDQWVF